MVESIFEDMHSQRMDALAKYAEATTRAMRAGVHAIGAAYAETAEIKPKHGIKQFDRFLSNKGLDVAKLRPAWTRFVLGGRQQVLLALDWTEFDDDDHATIRIYENADERRALKHTRWALLKNPWNLTAIQHGKLTELPKENATLYRAYLMKESFAAILDEGDPLTVRARLTDWISWATHSRIAPFVKAAQTIRKHLDGIVAYVETGLSNGRTEGTNGKVRTITRRSYGLHGAQALISLILLCCSGLKLMPPQTSPLFHQTCGEP